MPSLILREQLVCPHSKPLALTQDVTQSCAVSTLQECQDCSVTRGQLFSYPSSTGWMVTVTFHSSSPRPSLCSSCRSKNKEDRLSQGPKVELMDPLYLSQGRGGSKALVFLAREVPPMTSGDGASEQCKAQHS